MKKNRTKIICIRCGRGMDENEGFWLLCQACGTFRCPDCYNNPFEASDCPGCRKREQRKFPAAFLSLAMETAFVG